MKKKDIKYTIAKKLVDTLSIKDASEEDFFEYMKSVLVSFLDEDENLDEFMLSYKDYFSYDDIVDIMINVYINYFTEDEMLDLVNFFNTNIGKKWIYKQDVIIKDVITATVIYGADIAEKILKKMDE